MTAEVPPYWGPMAKSLIKLINQLSGVKDSMVGKGLTSKITGKEVFYLLYFYNLRGVIARENARLHLKHYKATGEFPEFDLS